MSEQKTLTRYAHNVKTTEEFSELQTAVKQAGGKILGVTSLRNGSLSVTIEIDSDKRF